MLLKQVCQCFSEHLFDRAALLYGKQFESTARLLWEVALNLHLIGAAALSF
jgi:hypothetical protein